MERVIIKAKVIVPAFSIRLFINRVGVANQGNFTILICNTHNIRPQPCKRFHRKVFSRHHLQFAQKVCEFFNWYHKYGFSWIIDAGCIRYFPKNFNGYNLVIRLPKLISIFVTPWSAAAKQQCCGQNSQQAYRQSFHGDIPLPFSFIIPRFPFPDNRFTKLLRFTRRKTPPSKEGGISILSKTLSLRTSPQAGVAIPEVFRPVFDRFPLNPGDSHASVRTGSE